MCVSLYSWRLRVCEGDMWGWEGRGNRALEKTAYRGSFTGYYSGDQVKVDEVGGGMWHFFWGRIEMYALFWWGNLMEGDSLEDLGVDGG